MNVIAAGVAVSVIARFALRTGQRWSWWFLAPYAYCLTMIVGLLRTRPVAFTALGDNPLGSTGSHQVLRNQQIGQSRHSSGKLADLKIYTGEDQGYPLLMVGDGLDDAYRRRRAVAVDGAG